MSSRLSHWLTVSLFVFAIWLCAPCFAADANVLQSELVRLDDEIAKAEADDAKLIGGLNKALIGTRLQVLKTDRELVAEYLNALETGAQFKMVAHAAQPNPVRAAELQARIALLDQEVIQRRAEGDKYIGGLTKAMIDSSIATMLNTRAMLESEMLSSRFGIVWPAVTPATLSKIGSSGTSSISPSTDTSSKDETPPASDVTQSVGSPASPDSRDGAARPKPYEPTSALSDQLKDCAKRGKTPTCDSTGCACK